MEEKKQAKASQADVVAIKPADVRPGMVVRVQEKIKDVTSKGEERERLQAFEGTVISVRGAGISRTMTVRKTAGGWGVEKIYPLASPVIGGLDLVRQFKVRRAKLNYLTEWRQNHKRPMREMKKAK
ncbi:50S ribosomal protein L19 [Patescibacteria group bacterium]|nr:MAG: 50S ribosomal protein L19 [Patescibacteria group bacterium]